MSPNRDDDDRRPCECSNTMMPQGVGLCCCKIGRKVTCCLSIWGILFILGGLVCFSTLDEEDGEELTEKEETRIRTMGVVFYTLGVVIIVCAILVCSLAHCRRNLSCDPHCCHKTRPDDGREFPRSNRMYMIERPERNRPQMVELPESNGTQMVELERPPEYQEHDPNAVVEMPPAPSFPPHYSVTEDTWDPSVPGFSGTPKMDKWDPIRPPISASSLPYSEDPISEKHDSELSSSFSNTSIPYSKNPTSGKQDLTIPGPSSAPPFDYHPGAHKPGVAGSSAAVLPYPKSEKQDLVLPVPSSAPPLPYSEYSKTEKQDLEIPDSSSAPPLPVKHYLIDEEAALDAGGATGPYLEYSKSGKRGLVVPALPSAPPQPRDQYPGNEESTVPQSSSTPSLPYTQYRLQQNSKVPTSYDQHLDRKDHVGPPSSSDTSIHNNKKESKQ